MKKLLLATTAAAAFIAMPAMAQDGDVEVDASVDIEYSNNIDTSLTTDATFLKLVGILGGAFVTGGNRGRQFGGGDHRRQAAAARC